MLAGRERIQTFYQRHDIAEDYIQSRYGRVCYRTLFDF